MLFKCHKWSQTLAVACHVGKQRRAEIQFCSLRSLAVARLERPRKCGFLVFLGYYELDESS